MTAMLTFAALFLAISWTYGIPLTISLTDQIVIQNTSRSSFRYVALGDSFSAGPGAGKDYDQPNSTITSCFRSEGSYPVVLNTAFQTSDFQFLSCSWDMTTKNITDFQSKAISWAARKTYLTLSVGADDLFLGNIAIYCLAMPTSVDLDGNCKKWTQMSWNLIRDSDENDTFYKSLSSAWASLAEPHLNSTTSGLKKYPPIRHTLYPKLFNAKNAGNASRTCDNASILRSGPKLTEALRANYNAVTDAANQKIVDSLVRFKGEKQNAGAIGQISILDPNPIYEGYRLCEPHTGDVPGFEDPNVWFFGPPGASVASSEGILPSSPQEVDPQTCNQDAISLTDALGCAYAKAKAVGSLSDDVSRDWNTTSHVDDPEDAIKFLHPKSSAHGQTAFLLSKDFNLLTAERQIVTRKHPIRVLPLGDSITHGFLSTDKNGYRKVFYDIATEGGAVNMVGSHKGEGNMTDNNEEGWNGFTIDQISDKASIGLQMTPNVILLHAGTNNMGSDEDAAAAPASMAALIDKVLEKRPNAALLVSTIVPAWDAARQARNDRYNLAIQDLVRTRRQNGKKILQVFMDAVVPPTQLIDGIHPTDEGYHNMGLHWLHGLDEAEELGWIVGASPPHWPTTDDTIALSIIIAAVVVVFVLAAVLA